MIVGGFFFSDDSENRCIIRLDVWKKGIMFADKSELSNCFFLKIDIYYYGRKQTNKRRVY